MAIVDPLFDPGVIEDPYEYLSQLCDNDPVHRLAGTSTFLVCRMDLIHRVISDTETFSSYTNDFLALGEDGMPCLRAATAGEGFDMDIPGVLATADPPDHGRHRKVVSRILSKTMVDAQEEHFRRLVDTALAPFLDNGAIEWMSAIAEPLPAVMVARILGLDEEVGPFLKEFGYASLEQISGFVSEERRAQVQQRLLDLGPVGEAYGRARNGEGPGPHTVIGACASAVAQGELDDLEAFSILLVLVSAGSESTTSLLGAGTRILAQDHDLQQQLREDVALIPAFVEEACRVDPPFRGHYRRATTDTKLEGVHIPANARVVLVWPAANRDPEAFEQATEICLERESFRQHVGFGWGIHLCVGAPLARLEARVAFERLLAGTTSFEVDPSETVLRHHKSLMVRRLEKLPLILRR